MFRYVAACCALLSARRGRPGDPFEQRAFSMLLRALLKNAQTSDAALYTLSVRRCVAVRNTCHTGISSRFPVEYGRLTHVFEVDPGSTRRRPRRGVARAPRLQRARSARLRAARRQPAARATFRECGVLQRPLSHADARRLFRRSDDRNSAHGAVSALCSSHAAWVVHFYAANTEPRAGCIRAVIAS